MDQNVKKINLKLNFFFRYFHIGFKIIIHENDALFLNTYVYNYYYFQVEIDYLPNKKYV